MSASLIAATLIFAASGSAVACRPIPGWDEILANPSARWLVIGETHGNNESPDIFADAVCLTAQVRPVVVAVEHPDADQAAIDAFLASDGGEAAMQAFLTADMWKTPDGRASEATLRLFQRLRTMKQAGEIRAVIAFVPSRFARPYTQAEYEERMANRLEEAAGSDATMLVLTGNVHAARTEVPWEPHYLPMSGHLPISETVTLNIVTNGGSTWACQGQPVSCGPMDLPAGRAQVDRGVVLDPENGGPFSGKLGVGAAATASEPEQP